MVRLEFFDADSRKKNVSAADACNRPPTSPCSIDDLGNHSTEAYDWFTGTNFLDSLLRLSLLAFIKKIRQPGMTRSHPPKRSNSFGVISPWRVEVGVVGIPLRQDFKAYLCLVGLVGLVDSSWSAKRSEACLSLSTHPTQHNQGMVGLG
jgi:hypothetical protein